MPVVRTILTLRYHNLEGRMSVPEVGKSTQPADWLGSELLTGHAGFPSVLQTASHVYCIDATTSRISDDASPTHNCPAVIVGDVIDIKTSNAPMTLAPRLLRLQAIGRAASQTGRIARPHIPQKNHSTRSQAKTPSDSSPVTPGFALQNRSAIAIGAIALLLGLMGGSYLSHLLAPPTLPDAETDGDGVLMKDLNNRIDETFKVQVLRGKCLAAAKQLKGQEGGWVEVVTPHRGEAADAFSSTQRRFITALAGAKGLGVERLFWNHGEQKLVAVVWFGGAVCGWPGITHGGAIATELSDKAALAATLIQTGVNVASEAAISQHPSRIGEHARISLPSTRIDDPEQLSLSYVKPTFAEQFYVIRISPAMPLEEDPEHIVPSDPAGGSDFEATLENLDSRILVKAKMRFRSTSCNAPVSPHSKGVLKDSSRSFQQSMWPSRQDSSMVG